MSNRPALLLLLRVRIGGRKNFKLFLPLPLILILSFTDMLDDLACLFRLFAPKLSYKTAGGRASPAAAAQMLTGALGGFIWELMFETGPLDIADVDIKDGENAVRVYCHTR